MASFEELKAKYNSVLEEGHDIGMTVQNLHAEGDKLLIRGVVCSEYAKNKIWDAVKAVDASVSDVIVDVNVASGLKYTVQSGDTLSKIAKRFYGDANQYHHLAKLSGIDNPDRIDVGQEITLS